MSLDGYYINSGPFQGRFADVRQITLSNEQVITTNADSAEFEVGDRRVGRFKLVLASSTITSLDVDIEVSPDGTTWYDSASFAQQSDDGTTYLVAMLDRYVRAEYTINGTTTTATLTCELV